MKLQTFEERYEYLKIGGRVGEETFGFDRYINQMLYKTPEWISARNTVIVRDNGYSTGQATSTASGTSPRVRIARRSTVKPLPKP